MGKVTIALTLLSTAVLLTAFGKGMAILRGADPGSHLQWALATLVTVLAANLVTIVHAGQSDRIIRELRLALDRAREGAGENASGGPVA